MIKKTYKSFQGTIIKLDLNYILRGGFWLSLSQAVTVTTVLATSYVFANYVDVYDYGIYKYIISLSIIFGALSLTGMFQSVVQATARGYYSFIKNAYKTSLVYGLSTTFIALAASLYYYIQENNDFAFGCLLIALCTPLISSSQLLQAQLQGLKRFSLAAKLLAVRNIISASAVILAISLSENIFYWVAAFFISNTVISIVIYQVTQLTLTLPTDTNVTNETRHKYISYAKHTSARDILTNFSYEVDKLLAFQLLGPAQLAIYAFAIAIPEQFKGVFKNLGLLILVKFTDYNLQVIKKNLFKKVLLLGIILIVLTATYIMAAPYIYATLFPDYMESVFLSQVFALSFPMMVVIFPISALQAQMREKDLHVLNIGTSILLIASLYVGVTFFGLIGLVVSRVFVRYVNCIATFILLYRRY